MATIDQIEKSGRFVLWIVLAAAAAMVPLGAYKLAQSNARTAEQVRLDAAKQAEKDKAEKAAKDAAGKPKRLSIESMGPVMSALNGNEGMVWFSNASAREGIVCIEGTASAGEQSTRSLATCEAIKPYETNVKMSVMFAGASIRSICSAGACSFSVKDAPLEQAAPAAIAAK